MGKSTSNTPSAGAVFSIPPNALVTTSSGHTGVVLGLSSDDRYFYTLEQNILEGNLIVGQRSMSEASQMTFVNK